MAHIGFEMALEGVVVVDLSRLFPGPFCSLLLSDMGADVIKVEAPKSGDYARWYPPMVGDYGTFFSSINRGKRSIALDLKRNEKNVKINCLKPRPKMLSEPRHEMISPKS